MPQVQVDSSLMTEPAFCLPQTPSICFKGKFQSYLVLPYCPESYSSFKTASDLLLSTVLRHCCCGSRQSLADFAMQYRCYWRRTCNSFCCHRRRSAGHQPCFRLAGHRSPYFDHRYLKRDYVSKPRQGHQLGVPPIHFPCYLLRHCYRCEI